MALVVGGEVDAAHARLRLVPGHPARRRLLADEAASPASSTTPAARRTCRAYLAVGRLAPLAGAPRRGVRAPLLARRAARARLRRSACSCRSAGSPGRRTRRAAVNDEALLAGSSSIFQALRAGIALAELMDDAAAGVGARRRPARPRAARAPRAVPRQVARSRWTGTTRCSAARSAATRRTRCWQPLGRLRRARPRRPLRRRPARG